MLLGGMFRESAWHIKCEYIKQPYGSCRTVSRDSFQREASSTSRVSSTTTVHSSYVSYFTVSILWFPACASENFKNEPMEVCKSMKEAYFVYYYY